MKWLWKRKTLLIVLLLLCLILLVCGWANTRTELLAFQNQISKFEFKEQGYLETINDNGNRIAEQEQIILTQEQAINNNLLEIKRLKEVNAQVVVNTITQIDSVFVPFYVDTTSIVLNDSIVDMDNFIQVPQQFSLSKEWYSFGGEITKTGLLMDSLSLFGELNRRPVFEDVNRTLNLFFGSKEESSRLPISLSVFTGIVCRRDGCILILLPSFGLFEVLNKVTNMIL